MTRLALALSLAVPGSVRGGGAPVAAIVISANTTPENSTAGTTVGTLSTVLTTGTAVFSLVDNAGSRFALSGAIIQRGATALDYETATYHNIVVGVTGVTPTISNTTLTINVTNIAEIPVLSVQPTLSPTSGAVGTLITCGTGTWTNTPTSYAYQWMRTGVDISGATSSTYTSVLADDTFTLTCKVLASNADGPAAGYSTTSNSHTVGASFTGILDSYTVGAAYSQRQLRSAYAGNCVRIRRSSDNAEQNFGFVSNVVDTAGIASFVGGGSGYIVTWYDQSGNTLDATTATAAAQPLFVASGIGSKPTARFDGTDILRKSSFTVTTLTNVNETTIMLAMKQTGSAANNAPFGWGTGGNLMSSFATYADVIYWDFGTGSGGGRINIAQPSGWDNSNRILELYRTIAGGQGIVVDGSVLLASTGQTHQPSGSGVFDIGNEAGGTTFTGDIAELIILKTDIGSSPRATIRADIGSYYGITVV